MRKILFLLWVITIVSGVLVKSLIPVGAQYIFGFVVGTIALTLYQIFKIYEEDN